MIIERVHSMVGGFETELMHHDGIATLVVRGELDAATAPQFAAACDAAVNATRGLVLDFAAVTFMDSTPGAARPCLPDAVAVAALAAVPLLVGQWEAMSSVPGRATR
jgi:hypothetical protein